MYHMFVILRSVGAGPGPVPGLAPGATWRWQILDSSAIQAVQARSAQ